MMLIPKEAFEVSALASTDSHSRYAINGVLVTRDAEGKCLAVTTDGRRLIRVRWDDEHLRSEFAVLGLGSVEPVKDFSVVVSTKQWDEAGKAIPKRTEKPLLRHCLLDETGASDKVTMGSTDLETERQSRSDIVDWKFPEWAYVIPDYTVGEDAVEIGVNPRLMAEVCKVMEAIVLDGEWGAVRLVIPTDPKRPIVIEGRNSSGVEATAVLMPVKLPGA